MLAAVGDMLLPVAASTRHDWAEFAAVGVVEQEVLATLVPDVRDLDAKVTAAAAHENDVFGEVWRRVCKRLACVRLDRGVVGDGVLARNRQRIQSDIKYVEDGVMRDRDEGSPVRARGNAVGRRDRDDR